MLSRGWWDEGLGGLGCASAWRPLKIKALRAVSSPISLVLVVLGFHLFILQYRTYIFFID
jgi:hypothetical protein